MAMIRDRLDLIHAMVRLNLNSKFTTTLNKRQQDGLGFVGHREKLTGLLAFELDP